MEEAVRHLNGQFNAIAAHGGALYAAGWTAPAGTRDYLIQKHGEMGNLLWSNTIAGPGDDELTGVVGIGSHVYAVGFTNSSGAGGFDAVILEIDPATGKVLSTSTFGGPQDDKANGAATDGVDLYVIGESRSFATGNNAVGSNDVMLLHYSM